MAKEEDDETTIIICANSPGTFKDNIEGRCLGCQTPICWRPHVPEPSLKYCGPCGYKRFSNSPGFHGFEVYEGQRKELEEIAQEHPYNRVSTFIRELLSKSRKH